MRPRISHRSKNYTLRCKADWLAISSDNSNAIMLSASYVGWYHDSAIIVRVLRGESIPNDRASGDGGVLWSEPSLASEDRKAGEQDDEQ